MAQTQYYLKDRAGLVKSYSSYSLVQLESSSGIWVGPKLESYLYSISTIKNGPTYSLARDAYSLAKVGPDPLNLKDKWVGGFRYRREQASSSFIKFFVLASSTSITSTKLKLALSFDLQRNNGTLKCLMMKQIHGLRNSEIFVS